tara:strand:- start:284 stop:532 length:249 start_codon:yes stop_codon:yes gene_type:complete
MKHYQEIIDELARQKDAFCEGMSEKEIEEINIYLDEVVKELEPLFESVESISSDPVRRKRAGQLFKEQIKELGWQEKLSKIF